MSETTTFEIGSGTKIRITVTSSREHPQVQSNYAAPVAMMTNNQPQSLYNQSTADYEACEQIPPAGLHLLYGQQHPQYGQNNWLPSVAQGPTQLALGPQNDRVPSRDYTTYLPPMELARNLWHQVPPQAQTHQAQTHQAQTHQAQTHQAQTHQAQTPRYQHQQLHQQEMQAQRHAQEQMQPQQSSLLQHHLNMRQSTAVDDSSSPAGSAACNIAAADSMEPTSDDGSWNNA
ncbi:uncharacterized protein LMH87_007672 [Akanthomyces muscarius]|uniref:Uncharacterized protein n=1 Tax=Akanthomyces muscarius TaxID=2231603 RepID=A0A9W8QML9_AKAMU|nr:uncharacterized protein LMH87_007672 [Akanthomyces muscarius]KAJ4161645.1 hypothetical protein LMH87_007672 [Akanthomyces muscarius]